MKSRLQMTTIELNGIRIEHNGGDEVSIHAIAPSAIKIGDLIDKLRLFYLKLQRDLKLPSILLNRGTASAKN